MKNLLINAILILVVVSACACSVYGGIVVQDFADSFEVNGIYVQAWADNNSDQSTEINLSGTLNQGWLWCYELRSVHSVIFQSWYDSSRFYYNTCFNFDISDNWPENPWVDYSQQKQIDLPNMKMQSYSHVGNVWNYYWDEENQQGWSYQTCDISFYSDACIYPAKIDSLNLNVVVNEEDDLLCISVMSSGYFVPVIPEPLTMILLGVGGLVICRKK
jgi:hypothetical protein